MLTFSRSWHLKSTTRQLILLDFFASLALTTTETKKVALKKMIASELGGTRKILPHSSCMFVIYNEVLHWTRAETAVKLVSL